jgi:hypothetical protein
MAVVLKHIVVKKFFMSHKKDLARIQILRKAALYL